MASLRTTNSCGRAMNLRSEAFVTRIGRALLAALALILAASGAAYAQSTHIQPKLIAESPAPAPGGATTLALTMTPDKTRSEEHTSELQSLMRISYAVFCLKKKKKNNTTK